MCTWNFSNILRFDMLYLNCNACTDEMRCMCIFGAYPGLGLLSYYLISRVCQWYEANEKCYIFLWSLCLWFSYSSALCYSSMSYVNLSLPSLGFIILFASCWCCSNFMYGFLCAKDVIYLSRHLIFIYLYLISLASLTRVFSLGSDRVCFRLGASLYLVVFLEFLSSLEFI